MKKILRKITDYRFTPVLLVFLVLIGYGLVTPFMGYFMDDWYLIWFKQLFGASQLPVYFSVDRPLMGFFYIVANFLLGNTDSQFVWQLFGLFTRWLCVYALWGFLSTLWPNAKRQNTMVVLLAAIYPGFTQQWIAVIYSYFFSCLALFFLSLTLMLKAAREPKLFWVYLIGSLFTGFYAYAAAEFYFGLELIRPVVLWIENARVYPTFKIRLRRTLVICIPFMIAYMGYAVWRAFFFVSVNHGVIVTDKLKQNALSVVIDLFAKTYQAGVDAVVNAWFNPLNLLNYPEKGIIPFLILTLVVIVFLIIGLWLWFTDKNYEPEHVDKAENWSSEALWLSFIALIVSVIPFWAADLPIDYLYPYDRFLLAYLFGSCLIIVLLFDNKRRGLILIAILVAISTGYQFNNGIRYKNAWVQQSDFFWQLTWRAPGLKSNTVLVSEDLPFSKYFSAPSMTAPLNMIYIPEQKSHEIPYLLVLNSQQKDIIKSYSPDLPITYKFRTFEFTGNTSNILVFKKPADGCLQIVSPTDSPEEYNNKFHSEFWQSVIPLSNLETIIPKPYKGVIPPQKYFGVENRNQWCYYFEKADLARQQKQWTEIEQYYHDAEAAGFSPRIDTEWIPYIEALIHMGDFTKALEITKNMNIQDSTVTAGLCNLWNKVRVGEAGQQYVGDSIAWLKCSLSEQ